MIRTDCIGTNCVIFDSQNWMVSPSPPAATGSNSGFASQFRPHVQLAVVEELQCDAAEYQVYGLKDSIWVVLSVVIP